MKTAVESELALINLMTLGELVDHLCISPDPLQRAIGNRLTEYENAMFELDDME